MRLSQKAGLAAAMMSVAILGSLEQAGAIDLTGAWAISADECKNVFVRKGKANQITFARCPRFMAVDSSLSRTG
jgi:hypothetical protein